MKRYSFLFCFLIPLCFSSLYAQSNGPLIQLLHPSESQEVVLKKPLIKCSVTAPFDPQRLLVLLDGIDVTALLDIMPNGFEYKSTAVLAPGPHVLNVTAFMMDGRETKQELAFKTRHSSKVEEAYSGNEVTMVYEKLLGKSDEASGQPSWKFESNLSTDSKLRERKWGFSFNTNLRYLHQNLPVPFPLERGFSLPSYLLRGGYQGERFGFQSEMGDVLIDESPNTVQGLGRRGGNLIFRQNDLHLQLRTFVVNSEQAYGFRDGIGIETGREDNIMGASGDLGLFSERVRLKTVYVTGGEEENSFGISTTDGPREGNVWGFLFRTDLFKQKLSTEAEFDLSKFDSDTSDEFPSERDKAYRIRVGGIWGIFDYEGLYEYMGPDYEVIGNPGLQKDREGFTLKAGGHFGSQTISLVGSKYNDNVKKNPLFPRINTYQMTVDYLIQVVKNLPVGVNYQRSIQDSTSEPDLTSPIKTYTDAVSATIQYLSGGWHLTLLGSYSVQNDRTPAANDTATMTATIVPHHGSVTFLGKETLSITPSFSYNRQTFRLTDVDTDTYTATLDLRGDFLGRKLTYELAGGYSWIRATDNSIRQDTANANFRVGYLLGKNLWGFLNPSVGIRGLYNRTQDRVLRQSTDEFALFLVLSSSMGFAF